MKNRRVVSFILILTIIISGIHIEKFNINFSNKTYAETILGVVQPSDENKFQYDNSQGTFEITLPDNVDRYTTINGESINWEMLKDENILVFGDYNDIDNNDKDKDGDYRYLGYSLNGLAYSNILYDNDADSGREAHEKNIISLDKVHKANELHLHPNAEETVREILEDYEFPNALDMSTEELYDKFLIQALKADGVQSSVRFYHETKSWDSVNKKWKTHIWYQTLVKNYILDPNPVIKEVTADFDLKSEVFENQSVGFLNKSKAIGTEIKTWNLKVIDTSDSQTIKEFNNASDAESDLKNGLSEGYYKFELYVSDDDGLSNTKTDNITVEKQEPDSDPIAIVEAPEIIPIDTDYTVSAEDSIASYGAKIINYEWYIDGTYDSSFDGQVQISQNYSSDGSHTYYVIIEDTKGKTATSNTVTTDITDNRVGNAEANIEIPSITYEGVPFNVRTSGSSVEVNGENFSLKKAVENDLAKYDFDSSVDYTGKLKADGGSIYIEEAGRHSFELEIDPINGTEVSSTDYTNTLSTPQAKYYTNGAKKENRLFIIDISPTVVHSEYPLNESKTQIKLTDTSTSETATFKTSSTSLTTNIKGNKITDDELEVVFKKDTDYELYIYVEDTRGESSTITGTINIENDESPTGEIITSDTHYRDDDIATIKIGKKFFSPDGDYFGEVKLYWKWANQSTSSYTLISNSLTDDDVTLEVDKLGEIDLLFEGTEDFETLSSYVSSSEYLSFSTSKRIKVDNYAPRTTVRAVSPESLDFVINTNESESSVMTKFSSMLDDLSDDNYVSSQIDSVNEVDFESSSELQNTIDKVETGAEDLYISDFGNIASTDKTFLYYKYGSYIARDYLTGNVVYTLSTSDAVSTRFYIANDDYDYGKNGYYNYNIIAVINDNYFWTKEIDGETHIVHFDLDTGTNISTYEFIDSDEIDVKYQDGYYLFHSKSKEEILIYKESDKSYKEIDYGALTSAKTTYLGMKDDELYFADWMKDSSSQQTCGFQIKTYNIDTDEVNIFKELMYYEAPYEFYGDDTYWTFGSYTNIDGKLLENGNFVIFYSFGNRKRKNSRRDYRYYQRTYMALIDSNGNTIDREKLSYLCEDGDTDLNGDYDTTYEVWESNETVYPTYERSGNTCFYVYDKDTFNQLTSHKNFSSEFINHRMALDIADETRNLYIYSRDKDSDNRRNDETDLSAYNYTAGTFTSLLDKDVNHEIDRIEIVPVANNQRYVVLATLYDDWYEHGNHAFARMDDMLMITVLDLQTGEYSVFTTTRVANRTSNTVQALEKNGKIYVSSVSHIDVYDMNTGSWEEVSPSPKSDMYQPSLNGQYLGSVYNDDNENTIMIYKFPEDISVLEEYIDSYTPSSSNAQSYFPIIFSNALSLSDVETETLDSLIDSLNSKELKVIWLGKSTNSTVGQELASETGGYYSTYTTLNNAISKIESYLSTQLSTAQELYTYKVKTGEEIDYLKFYSDIENDSQNTSSAYWQYRKVGGGTWTQSSPKTIFNSGEEGTYYVSWYTKDTPPMQYGDYSKYSIAEEFQIIVSSAEPTKTDVDASIDIDVSGDFRANRRVDFSIVITEGTKTLDHDTLSVSLTGDYAPSKSENDFSQLSEFSRVFRDTGSKTVTVSIEATDGTPYTNNETFTIQSDSLPIANFTTSGDGTRDDNGYAKYSITNTASSDDDEIGSVEYYYEDISYIENSDETFSENGTEYYELTLSEEGEFETDKVGTTNVKQIVTEYYTNGTGLAGEDLDNYRVFNTDEVINTVTITNESPTASYSVYPSIIKVGENIEHYLEVEDDLSGYEVEYRFTHNQIYENPDGLHSDSGDSTSEALENTELKGEYEFEVYITDADGASTGWISGGTVYVVSDPVVSFEPISDNEIEDDIFVAGDTITIQNNSYNEDYMSTVENHGIKYTLVEYRNVTTDDWIEVSEQDNMTTYITSYDLPQINENGVYEVRMTIESEEGFESTDTKQITVLDLRLEASVNPSTIYSSQSYDIEATTSTDATGVVAKITRALNVRYIRDWTNGSTSNSGDHWVEIQAFEDGTNVALGKDVSCGGASPIDSKPLSRLVDGETNSSYYTYTSSSSQTYMEIDLGEEYAIDEIVVWHYYKDGRSYYDTKTEVSQDGITWYSVFDSDSEGEYQETEEGHTIDFSQWVTLSKESEDTTNQYYEYNMSTLDILVDNTYSAEVYAIYPYNNEINEELTLTVDTSLDLTSDIKPFGTSAYNTIIEDNIDDNDYLQIAASESIQVEAEIVTSINVDYVKATLEGETEVTLIYNSSSNKYEGEILVPDSKSDKDHYDLTIETRIVNGNIAINNHRIKVETPIDLAVTELSDFLSDTDVEIKASTTKYAAYAEVNLYKDESDNDTAYTVTETLSSTLDDDNKVWDITHYVDPSIPEGDYLAEFIASTPNGNSETVVMAMKVINTKLENLRIVKIADYNWKEYFLDGEDEPTELAQEGINVKDMPVYHDTDDESIKLGYKVYFKIDSNGLSEDNDEIEVTAIYYAMDEDDTIYKADVYMEDSEGDYDLIENSEYRELAKYITLDSSDRYSHEESPDVTTYNTWEFSLFLPYTAKVVKEGESLDLVDGDIKTYKLLVVLDITGKKETGIEYDYTSKETDWATDDGSEYGENRATNLDILSKGVNHGEVFYYDLENTLEDDLKLNREW